MKNYFMALLGMVVVFGVAFIGFGMYITSDENSGAPIIVHSIKEKISNEYYFPDKETDMLSDHHADKMVHHGRMMER